MVVAGRWWVVVGCFSLGACAQAPTGTKTATPVLIEAQGGGPSDEGAVPMPYAGEYVFRHDHDAEHGCSQSFESASDHASFVLRISAGGEVTLSLTVDNASTFGPSPGRYMAGDRDFSHRNGRGRFFWRGKAVFDGVWLRVTLDREEATCEELSPHKACGGAEEGTLACEEVTVDTDVPGSSEERSGPTVVALRCKGKLGLDTVVPAEIAKGDLLFASKPGLVRRTGRGMWEQRRTVQVATE